MQRDTQFARVSGTLFPVFRGAEPNLAWIDWM